MRTFFKTRDECTITWHTFLPYEPEGEDRKAKEIIGDGGDMGFAKVLVIDDISIGDIDFICKADNNQLDELYISQNAMKKFNSNCVDTKIRLEKLFLQQKHN